MTRNPLLALPARLLVPLLLALLALPLAAVIYLDHQQKSARLVEAQERLRLAERLALEQTRLEVQAGQRNALLVRRLVSGLGLHRGLTHAWLVDAGGRVLAAPARPAIGQPLAGVLAREAATLREAVSAARRAPASAIRIERIAGEQALLAWVTIHPGQQLIARVDLAQPIAEYLYASRGEIALEAGALLGFAALLAALLHLLWFRRAARLQATAKAIGGGDLGARAGLRGDDELARVGNALDTMAARLEMQQRQLGQLGELITRSPVVAIVWRNEPGWPLAFVSDNIARWGHSRAALLTGELLYADLIHPDDRPRIDADVAAHLANGPDDYTQEYRLRHGDGSWLWIEDRTWLARDGNGRVTAIQGVILDVGERKAKDLALQQSEARYRQLFEANPHPMWVFDRETLAFLAVNDAAVSHYGYTRDEFLGMTIKDIRPAEDHQRLLANPAAVEEGLDAAGAWRHVTRDKRLIEVEITSHTLEFDGRPGELVLAHDVTLRNATERALRDSESRLRQAQRQAHIGSWELDHRSGQLTWSDEAFRIFEIDPARFAASYGAFLALVHPDDREAVDGTFQRSLQTREPYATVHRLLFPDGRIKHMQEQCETEFAADGRPLRSLGTVQDISEVRRAEAALRASEERFRKLAENSADWIWTLDLDGQHTFSNPAGMAILGYELPEFLALDATTLVHPDDLGVFAETFARAVAGRSGWRNVAVRWRRRDGEYRTLESSAAPIFDAAGSLLGFQGVDRDITERIRAEQERMRLVSMLEASTDIVSMADPRGKLIYMNGPGRALMGIAPDGALPDVIPKVHPPWAADLILGTGLPTAIRDGSWLGETAILGAGGEEIPVSQLILSHKDQHGELLFLSTIMRDIRASRAAEQALRDSEERLRLALQAANQGLYDLDLATGEAKTSPEYARMLGCDPETFHETNAAWRERLHPDDRDAVYRVFEDYVSGRIPEYRVEFRQRTQDGAWKWILSLGRVQEWSADGKPLRMLGTHTDLDAIKQAEASLRELNAGLEARVAERTAQLQELNRSLETFVYSVSHDLKTPLRGVDGYSRLLEEDHAARLDDEGRLFIANIRAGVARMDDLINDLLAYSRMERKHLATAAVDPGDLVARLLAERESEVAALGTAVRVALPPLAVTADPDGLSLVLRNLFDNALKFSGKVAAPTIDIGARSEGGTVTLWVRDNGIGFDMKYHDRIFEIFQRLHRLEDYPGTGIGLALVRRAMQRMGGQVWAESGTESAPGGGATFYLRLPAAG